MKKNNERPRNSNPHDILLFPFVNSCIFSLTAITNCNYKYVRIRLKAISCFEQNEQRITYVIIITYHLSLVKYAGKYKCF